MCSNKVLLAITVPSFFAIILALVGDSALSEYVCLATDHAGLSGTIAGFCARRRHIGKDRVGKGPRQLLRMSGQEERVKIPVESSWVNAKVIIKQSPVVVIALHPWGPAGGSMNDPHPTQVCSTFAKSGCSTARFDFRTGIGSGSSSVEDVRAVSSWFVEPYEGAESIASQVLIVGYSYGSIIGAAAAADIPRNIGYAVIGPPLDVSWALYVFNAAALRSKAAISDGKPKLLVIGTRDQFCSQPTFDTFVNELPEPKQAVILDGLHHMAYYPSLPQVLNQWVRAAFGVPDMETFARTGAASSTTSVAITNRT